MRGQAELTQGRVGGGERAGLGEKMGEGLVGTRVCGRKGSWAMVFLARLLLSARNAQRRTW